MSDNSQRCNIPSRARLVRGFAGSPVRRSNCARRSAAQVVGSGAGARGGSIIGSGGWDAVSGAAGAFRRAVRGRRGDGRRGGARATHGALGRGRRGGVARPHRQAGVPGPGGVEPLRCAARLARRPAATTVAVPVASLGPPAGEPPPFRCCAEWRRSWRCCRMRCSGADARRPGSSPSSPRCNHGSPARRATPRRR